jgi:hypothetical protein
MRQIQDESLKAHAAFLAPTFQPPDHQRGEISMRALIVGLAIILSACASAGTQVAHANVFTLQIDKTTYQEVAAQLGAPMPPA